MDNKEFRVHLQGILAENREHPPKPRRIKCGRCRNCNPKALTCSLYPDGIPKAVLKEQEDCPEFKEK